MLSCRANVKKQMLAFGVMNSFIIQI
jgi:hypothetical protein